MEIILILVISPVNSIILLNQILVIVVVQNATKLQIYKVNLATIKEIKVIVKFKIINKL